MERSRRTYSVELYSATYKVEGIYQPLGDLLSAINDPERGYFNLSDATLTPLRADSSLRPARMPQAGFGKREVNLVCFPGEDVVEEMHLLPRVERMIIYTPAFALRGDLHMGVEHRLRDVLDTARGRFQPMTDVTLFPLIETRVSLPRAASILLLNTEQVQVYYPEATPT